MSYSTWAKRFAWFLASVGFIYLLGILLLGPPFVARKHPFTWNLNFQPKIERLASGVSSEEELIDALRRRGFEMWMRPENPINGRAVSYNDRDRDYTTYDDFVRRHEQFQAAFPDVHRIYPRIAETSYGFIPCAHKFHITWQLEGGQIVNLEASDHVVCL